MKPDHHCMDKHIQPLYRHLGIVKPTNDENGIDKYIIKWPDKSVRFLFSIRGFSCGFSAFKNFGSFRYYLLKIIILLHHFFKIPVGKLLTKRKISVINNGLLNHAMQIEDADDWDIFGGTPGLQRNIVVALIKKEKICAYLKIPYNLKKTSYNLGSNNEACNYQIIKDMNLSSCIVPNFSIFENGLIVSPISGRRIRNKDACIIKKSLKEIYTKKNLTMSFLDYSKEKNFYSRIADLKLKKPLDGCFKKNDLLVICSALENKINKTMFDSEVICSFSLIDFTPWNTLVVDNQLGLYDVEFAEQDVSVGYDLFHFYIQPMLVSKSHQLEFLNAMHLRELEEKFNTIYGLPVQLMRFYLDLYLIQNAIRAIELYVFQEELHWQAIKQIEFWKKIDEIWLDFS